MPFPLSRLVLIVLVLLIPAVSWSAPPQEDPEESDFPPGLLARFEQAGQTVERIDPDVAFDWQQGAPDVRLSAGPFAAEWTGYFLMKSAGEYQFHAYVAGEVTVELDERIVLEARSDQPQWISGPATDFSFGELPFTVTYRKTGPQGVVKLFWSSPQFALEPISTHLLFREAGNQQLAATEQGRVAFRAWRCGQCHSQPGGNELAETAPLAAPALSQVASNMTGAQVMEKLLQPARLHDHMPEFPGLTAQEAADIATALLQAAKKPVKPVALKVAKPAEDQAAGELLVRSTGCLACHVIDERGNSGPFGGGDLSNIGNRRSRDWLALWLKQPAQLNAQHRMPELNLNDTQIRQVAVYLASRTAGGNDSAGSKSTPVDQLLAGADRQRGHELIASLRCASCHEIPGAKPVTTAISLQQIDGANSCLQAGETKNSAEETSKATTLRPRFSRAPRAELQAWLQAWPERDAAATDAAAKTADPTDASSKQKGVAATFIRGQDLLVEKNCLACHSRDRHAGNVAVAGDVAGHDRRLAGQSQALIPPHLTAAGDRLQDAALTEAIAGKQPRRMPWLQVQMPKFKHTPEESEALLTYLIGHDRLPAGIPDPRLQLATAELPAAEDQLLGRDLIGGRAFNCIACHKVGSYEPRNTAPGTKGSDLLTISGRMRPEYFLRWTMSPIRIVPGMEMPSFNQPRPGFATHALDQQLSALWRAFNDPTFTAPSNSTVVEQYLVVGPQQPPQVVRDVFDVSPMGSASDKKKREFLPRPLAVGLPNGHSLLFDLETMTLRGWNYGDFAFQQTEGKSWFWSLAGAPLAADWAALSPWMLRAESSESADQAQPKTLKPLTFDARQVFPRGYQTTDQAVQLEYEIRFGDRAQPVSVLFLETWSPLLQTGADLTKTGWRRTVRAQGIPEGYQLQLTQQADQVLLGSPEIVVQGKAQPLQAGQALTFDCAAAATKSGVQLDYLAGVSTRSTQPLPARPEVQDFPAEIVGTPGFQASRLPLPGSIMPTSLAWLDDGRLVFTSLKGHVFAAEVSPGSTQPESLQILETGLAAPFGILPRGDRLLIAHKPEVIEIPVDRSRSPGFRREIRAEGWGLTDDYHDWTTGFAEDANGNIYVATGSNYSQKGRPEERSRYRGDVLKLTGDRAVESISTEHRYPIGVAADPAGRIFTTDQQGVQNCFNEINHIVPGRAFGVPALNQPQQPETRASIQLPHPWTRSVNGLFFIPDRDGLGGLEPFRGHGIGCEYNNRFLVRFSLQEVGGEVQGACYELTRSIESLTPDAPLLLGPICGGVGPEGAIYIGSILDSGWLGGRNIGEIVRLQPETRLPNGLREIRATPDGFEIEFLEPLDREFLKRAENYDLSGYTRVWQGSYATPDTGRYRPEIQRIDVDASGRTVRLTVSELRPSYVYDVHIKNQPQLFPASGYYTMNLVPGAATSASRSSGK